jgi:hypothetical protein
VGASDVTGGVGAVASVGKVDMILILLCYCLLLLRPSSFDLLLSLSLLLLLREEERESNVVQCVQCIERELVIGSQVLLV